MSEKLKPCPFCGGEPYMVDAEIDGRAHYIVKCGACYCTTGVMEMSRSKAAEAWNRRAERTCHMLPDKMASNAMCGPALRCDACGAAVPAAGTTRYCPNCGARVVERHAD